MIKDSEEQFTKVPNYILDNLGYFDHTEGLVFLFMIRKIKGWHKDKDRISLTQFQSSLRMSRNTVIKAISKLSKSNVITIKKNVKGRDINEYSMLPPERWLPRENRRLCSIKNEPPSTANEPLRTSANNDSGGATNEPPSAANEPKGSANNEHTKETINKALKLKKHTQKKPSPDEDIMRLPNGADLGIVPNKNQGSVMTKKKSIAKKNSKDQKSASDTILLSSGQALTDGIKIMIDAGYEKLNGKRISWKGGQAGKHGKHISYLKELAIEDLKNEGNSSPTGDEMLYVIRGKAIILYEGIKSSDKNKRYWREMGFLYSTIVSLWNKLIETKSDGQLKKEEREEGVDNVLNDLITGRRV